MGVFDKFADAPDQIRKEGQEITVRFQRTGPTTGRISWNIPMPAAGCAAGTQAYDGIVITVNGKPSNYLSNSPKDGTYYNGDATGDADLHIGDKLDGALVVGAFYHDKTTTFLDVNDILPKTPYYVSAYAVDGVGRYHREGVHAYSLPTGSEEWGMPDTQAKHDIQIDVVGGIVPSTPTGLVPDTQYKFKVLIDNKEYILTVEGENVTNYADLVSELKEQLSLLGDVYVSPLPPNTNQLYFNVATGELKLWDGEKYVVLAVLVHAEDPTMQEIGALWFEPSTKLLKRFNGSSWVVTSYISLPYSPADLACDQSWFDGTNVWLYKLTHWEKLYTYIQTRNPLLPPELTCDDYWYNTADGSVSVWDVDMKAWVPVNVIYFETDPNLLNTGDFWYDEKAKKVKQYVASNWGIIEDVKYIDTLPADADYTALAEGHNFIYAIADNKLMQFVTDTWIEQAIVAFPLDPRDRSKSTLWWDATTDTLKAWDAINDAWVEVSSFTQSDIDPSLPVPVVENSAWYNPETKEVKLVFKKGCKTIYPIIFNGNPGNLPVDTVWFDSDDNKWYVWDGSVFNETYPMYYPTDPYIVVTDYYWFDKSADKLKRWTGTTWVEVEFVTKPNYPVGGSFWFNSVNDSLFVWDGKAWVPSLGLASVALLPPENSTSRSILSFFTRGVGCGSKIEVVLEADYLLSHLTQPIIPMEPVSGASGLVGGSTYNQLGIGTDGSPDERRALHDFVRNALGHPIVQVELTKEQLDQCIDKALGELRKYSSYAYRRNVFFLDLKPNQQTYLMTNKCVGFNKIVGVNAIYRHRGFAMGASNPFGNDVFSAAAMQRLYTMGTFDMLSYHLVASYMEELETLFASRVVFNWKEMERELSIFTRVWGTERVLLDAYIERTEQDLMVDRQTNLWLKNWSVAEAKHILSQSRGKFQSLPGPNGSTTLNGSELAQQADDEKTKLREELENGAMQDLSNLGLAAHFIWG